MNKPNTNPDTPLFSAQTSWVSEKEAEYLYGVLASGELDAAKKALFEQLSNEAQNQAAVWAASIDRLKGVVPQRFTPSPRTKLVAMLIRRLGVRQLLQVLAAMKVRGLSVYRSVTPGLGHEMPVAITPENSRHRGVDSGGSLRAAVFGVNDGLVSNLSLILGVAGAASEPQTIVLAGIAGLLAGAFSMAAGEYISIRSQREMFEYQIGLEREELALYPAQEAEELALIYQARGVPLAAARSLTAKLLENPAHALDTLAREELGLNPDELGSPWGAAFSSFLAFTVGGIVPLLPLLFASKAWAVPLSAVFGVLGLFVVGATLSLFTGRQALRSGLRMVLIGGGAALVTFLVGKLMGVSLS